MGADGRLFAMLVTKTKAVGYIISNRTSCLILSLFTKVSLAFSCTLPKVACFQSFLLTHCDFCGNLSQQFNITYLLRVPARLPKEPEQVFNFLSLHNEPEPRPSRKGWSGSGCCVAIFYCQIQHRTLKIERPSAWDAVNTENSRMIVYPLIFRIVHALSLVSYVQYTKKSFKRQSQDNNSISLQDDRFCHPTLLYCPQTNGKGEATR